MRPVFHFFLQCGSSPRTDLDISANIRGTFAGKISVTDLNLVFILIYCAAFIAILQSKLCVRSLEFIFFLLPVNGFPSVSDRGRSADLALGIHAVLG